MAALAITAESLLSGSSTSRVSYEHTWWQDATGPMSLNGTFRKCRSRCVMSAYRGRPEVIGEGSKRRDLPNADFKSFVLSVTKRRQIAQSWRLLVLTISPSIMCELPGDR